MSDTTYYWGTGRRKTSVARVRLKRGEGKITVNGRAAEQYFTDPTDVQSILEPLRLVNAQKDWDIIANVSGGGLTGQSGAVVLGVARALTLVSDQNEAELRKARLLTRDSRMRERKKYGQKGARARFQFSKR